MTRLITEEERDHLWDHFKFNADQRIKAFNFFVILSVFVNGGLFNAYDKNLGPLITGGIGLFIIILALIFFLIDTRSRELTELSIPGLKQYENQEQGAPEICSIFNTDYEKRGSLVRYTFAFRVLYFAQALVGIAVFYASYLNYSVDTKTLTARTVLNISCSQPDTKNNKLLICTPQ